ncbi:MAG: PGPGW domain-containing protein [Actinomycetota bacterium]
MEESHRASVVTKAVRIAGGTATTLTGVALLVLPGPGLLLIVAGLGILGKDIPVAARLHQRTMAYAKRAASGTANGARKLRRNR